MKVFYNILIILCIFNLMVDAYMLYNNQYVHPLYLTLDVVFFVYFFGSLLIQKSNKEKENGIS